ncbi:MAG: hypothetical protein NUV61_00310 [Candidatus Azambacteria bacterium]|nr:hypothetical protein [Candidatus Azambacteria bacterium]
MRSVAITPHVIRVIVLAIILVGIGGYFGWQLYNLFRPPFLVVTNPIGDIITEEQVIDFSGRTQKESDTSINGTHIEVTDTGVFREQFPLQDGMNVFEVRSVNKFGKETKLIRRIIKQ